MPYKVIAVGAEALAADVNNLLMEQTVARFTNAGQRAADLVAPELNQLSMLDNRPGAVQYWTGSAWADIVPFVQAGYATITTDAQGVGTFNFPVAYGAAPYVIAAALTGPGQFLAWTVNTINATTATTATVSVINSNSSPVVGTIGIVWFAVGPRA